MQRLAFALKEAELGSLANHTVCILLGIKLQTEENKLF